MNNVSFELDKASFRKLVLQSPEMLAATEKAARQKAGSDTHHKSFIGFDRAKTIIYPNTTRHPS